MEWFCKRCIVLSCDLQIFKTDFCFKELVEIGAKPPLLLAPILINYLNVNSQRLIFSIADPKNL